MENLKNDNDLITGWLSSKLPVILIIIALVATVLACVAVWYYHSYFPGSIRVDLKLWGAFGDFFGGTLNPIFGFFGLIALLLTLAIQNRELKVSSDALTNSARELYEQNKSLKEQNYERTLFEMVNLMANIVQDLDIDESTGRDCFKVLYDARLRGSYTTSKRQSQDKHNNEYILNAAYDGFIQKYHHEIGHYFRTLYIIFKYIEDYDDPEGKKLTYIDIVRAQLSSYELCLLFYNSHHDIGKMFKPLIEDFSLFENMEKKDLLEPSEHIDLYASKAYGKQNIISHVPCAN